MWKKKMWLLERRVPDSCPRKTSLPPMIKAQSAVVNPIHCLQRASMRSLNSPISPILVLFQFGIATNFARLCRSFGSFGVIKEVLALRGGTNSQQCED